jgi:rhamnose utilization protein RhaD (predicted bifunctional aldolase and dehydrogenase)
MTILDDLVKMSNDLGVPGNDFAVLGEGNTSAKVDGDSFYVKGSGCSLATMVASDFVDLKNKTNL